MCRITLWVMWLKQTSDAPRSDRLIVRICCMWKSKLTAQDHRSSNVKQRVNHLSLLLYSPTSHAGRSFGFSQHIALVACLSLLITPLYSKSTSREKKKIKKMLLHTHSLPWKKKILPSFLIFRSYTDGETTSAKQRKTLFWRARLFSALRFSINNRFSSAVSQIKASQLLSYPTQLWGEEASVARQNS